MANINDGERRAASGIMTGLLLGVTPGADVSAIRQQIGWGYSGLSISLPSTEEATLSKFVYRRQRLTARKRIV